MVELGFENGLVDGIFFVLGYNLKGSVVAQGNPIVGVDIYLHSDDVSKVDCPKDLVTLLEKGSPYPQKVSGNKILHRGRVVDCN